MALERWSVDRGREVLADPGVAEAQAWARVNAEKARVRQTGNRDKHAQALEMQKWQAQQRREGLEEQLYRRMAPLEVDKARAELAGTNLDQTGQRLEHDAARRAQAIENARGTEQELADRIEERQKAALEDLLAQTSGRKATTEQAEARTKGLGVETQVRQRGLDELEAAGTPEEVYQRRKEREDLTDSYTTAQTEGLALSTKAKQRELDVAEQVGTVEEVGKLQRDLAQLQIDTAQQVYDDAEAAAEDAQRVRDIDMASGSVSERAKARLDAEKLQAEAERARIDLNKAQAKALEAQAAASVGGPSREEKKRDNSFELADQAFRTGMTKEYLDGDNPPPQAVVAEVRSKLERIKDPAAASMSVDQLALAQRPDSSAEVEIAELNEKLQKLRTGPHDPGEISEGEAGVIRSRHRRNHASLVVDLQRALLQRLKRMKMDEQWPEAAATQYARAMAEQITGYTSPEDLAREHDFRLSLRGPSPSWGQALLGGPRGEQQRGQNTPAGSWTPYSGGGYQRPGQPGTDRRSGPPPVEGE